MLADFYSPTISRSKDTLLIKFIPTWKQFSFSRFAYTRTHRNIFLTFNPHADSKRARCPSINSGNELERLYPALFVTYLSVYSDNRDSIQIWSSRRYNWNIIPRITASKQAKRIRHYFYLPLDRIVLYSGKRIGTLRIVIKLSVSACREFWKRASRVSSEDANRLE